MIPASAIIIITIQKRFYLVFPDWDAEQPFRM